MSTIRGVSDRGFTLIELIVVMALITTMTAFALPKIRASLFTNQLNATARKLIGLVAETGEQARGQRKAVELRFDRKEHIFTTAPAAGITSDAAVKQYPSIEVDESIQIVDVATAHGGTQDRGDLSIRFSRRGYVDKTVVHIRDDDGGELSIIISPFLGVTRVLEGYVTLADDQMSVSAN